MKIATLSLLCLTAIVPVAFGDTVALTSVVSNDVAGHGNYDLAGYEFSTATDIDVDALGIFVSGSTLASSHIVGVYDTSGDLLFDATISSGSAKDSSGYAWVDLPGTNLLTAGNYFIGAAYNIFSPDYMFDGYGAITMADGLNYLDAKVYYSGSPIDPTNPAAGNGQYHEAAPRAAYIGPNFEFTQAAQATPEPATWAMILIGGACLIAGRLRK